MESYFTEYNTFSKYNLQKRLIRSCNHIRNCIYEKKMEDYVNMARYIRININECELTDKQYMYTTVTLRFSNNHRLLKMQSDAYKNMCIIEHHNDDENKTTTYFMYKDDLLYGLNNIHKITELNGVFSFVERF